MKNKTCLIIFFLSVIHFSYSANIEWLKGYIVTNASDTIHGQLAYRDGQGDWKECLFRQSYNAEYKTFSPEQIRAYGYDSGLSFVSKEVKLFKVRQRLFIQPLLLGVMDLYYLDIKKCPEFPNGYAAYIVRNTSDQMMELIDPSKSDNRDIVRRQNKAKLNYLFSGYHQLQEDIKKLDADRYQWIALFQKYHDTICNDTVCTYYEEKKMSSHWFLTPYLMGKYNKVGFNNLVNENSFTPGVGIAVTRSISKFTDRNLFHIGLELSGISVSSHGKGTEQIDFSTLSLINYYNYENRFVYGKVAPLFEVGVFHGLQFTTENKLESQYDILKNVDYSKYFYGISLGTGIAFKTKHTWIPVKIQYRYYFWGARSLEGVSLNKINGVTLSVGYNFRL